MFGDLPWTQSDLSGEAAVQRVQTLLSELGYNPGPADGAAGARTRAAIISYQRDNGLRQSGQVDAALIERLEADAAR